jgi:EAL domain-containing protein (putative c-di-GMP-specific phosphodiesterase class I)
MLSTTVPSGTVIFREGDAADCAYLIEEGWIEIFTGDGSDRHVLALLGVGEIFGEMGVIDGAPRTASATVAENCRLIRVSAGQFHEALARSEPFHAELLRKLVQRFRASQKALIEGRRAPRLESSNVGAGYAELAQQRDISEALVRGEIEPFLQPIVDLETGRLRGFEALARWRCAKRGVVPPFDFLPLAERTGLIRLIDLAVAERALAIVAGMDASEGGPFISLNFSAWHFRDDGLVAGLKAMLLASKVAPQRVRVELTETVMIEDPDMAERNMTALSELGVHLALDDFGAGYSSMSVLARMPIDVLKIDRSLVQDILRPGRPRSVFRAIMGLAEDIGMQVVAEGIEDEATRQALLDLGCRHGQGYLFGRPLPADEAVKAWAARE